MRLADSVHADATRTEARQADLDRIIGRYRGDREGPLLLCIAGMHGNEPAGVLALRRVFRELERRRPPFRGDFVALAGNLTALARGCRFVDEDLNRVWQRERVRRVRRSLMEAGGDSRLLHGEEAREQRDLLASMDEATASARGSIFVLDLHTTSAESKPFVTLGDTLPSRTLAEQFPLPIILGLEEQLDGALLEFLDSHGLVGVGIEGGSHAAADSVDAHEASLWIALAAVGNLEPDQVPDLAACRRRLADETRRLPRVMEVRHRHAVEPGDEFAMRPGYENFQKIRAGEVVARDARGPIRAPEAGRIFLPLYQEWGDDGYFIVREVRPVWLKVSAALRALRLQWIAPLIPGVRRHPERDDALIVRPFAAREAVIGLLHLLGFRKRVEDGTILMIRRRDDRPRIEGSARGNAVGGGS